jgi:nucleotide-binding universal stress UspA family protein
MKPILFATNYTAAAEHAGDYAAQVAKLCGAPLIVFHSWTIPILTPEDAVVAQPFEVFHEREQAVIEKEVMRLRTKWNIPVSGVQRQGYAESEIEDICKTEGVSLVIMGMHHHGFFSRLLGSVATKSIHHAGYPVLLIPENAVYVRPGKILFAAGNELNVTATSLNPLKLLVRNMDASLELVHVSDPDEIWNIIESDSAINFEILLKQIPHKWNFESNSSASTGILKAAENTHADWIAVAPRHFNWLEAHFKRSVTENLAFSSTRPILILPSDSVINQTSNQSTHKMTL